MKKKTRLYRFQYSLKTLLIFVSVFGIFMSWFGMKYNKATQQKKAIEKIYQLNGYVMYDWEDAGTKPPGPKCLRYPFGDNMFWSVVNVSFGHDSQVKDKDAFILEDLPNIEFIFLKNTRISDDYLRNFKNLKNLNEVSLEGTKISNKGLEYLAECSKLEIINLSNNSINDYGLEYLQKLDNVKELNLCNTNITDKGLLYLRHLQRLRLLNIHCCTVSSEAVNLLRESIPCIIIRWDSSNEQIDNQIMKNDLDLPPPCFGPTR